MRPDLILWLAVTVGVFLGAASASRAYVANPVLVTLLGALALYTIGNLMMLKLMRETGMSVAISISAIGQLVLVNLVAMSFFGERPNGTQLAGIGLGILAMALILWPAAERS